METQMRNKEVYLNSAYEFLKYGYNALSISRQAFVNEVNKSPPKFGIIRVLEADTSDNIVINFEGWNDLRSIFKEGMEMLDEHNENVACFRRSQHVFYFDVITNSYCMHIERDFIVYGEVLSITKNKDG